MARREYSLDFITSADLTGANAAAKGVEKVGDAATKSGSKLDAMEREYKDSMARIKGILDKAQQDLRESGEQGGKATGEGMGQGLNIAANLHLIQQAWAIGSQIGGMLGKGIEAAQDGSLEDLKTSLLSWFGVQSALVEEEMKRQQQTLPAKHREINAAVLREYRTFWDDYNDITPQTVGEWLDELGKKADLAATKLRGLSELQTAAAKFGKSKAEQDFLDEKDQIENDQVLPESVKKRKMLEAEEKRDRELERLRQEDRQNQARGINAGVQGKEGELAAVKQQEAEQRRIAEAYSKAKAMADAEIKGRKGAGQNMTPEDERATRDTFFRGVSRNTGINLDQDRDDAAALEALKQRRLALEEEAAKARIEADAKKKALALEEANDSMVSERERQRRKQRAEQEIAMARDKERAENESYVDREQGLPGTGVGEYDVMRPGFKKPAAPELPPGTPNRSLIGEGQADATELMKGLGNAAQATGNSGLKMDLEALRRALGDGANEAELKEAFSLMQRAAGERNDAMSAAVAATRNAISTTSSELQNMRREIAALNASVEGLKNR